MGSTEGKKVGKRGIWVGMRRYERLLHVSVIALAVLLTATIGGLTWLDSDTAMLGWALLGLTAALAVTNLVSYAGWVAAVIGSALYAGLQVSLRGATIDALVNSVISTAGLMGTAFLSSVIAQQVSTLGRQLDQAEQAIGELTVHDPQTGLTKWQYASRVIRSEIARSRRYHTNLSLLLIRVANWDELVEQRGPAEAEALMADTSAVVVDTLRNLVDTPTRFDGVTLGAVLPETSAEGARMAAQRLMDAVARKVRVVLYVGIAHFPDDAVTDRELLRAAEAALQFAVTSGQYIVCYNQLSSIIEVDEENVDDVDDDAAEVHRAPSEVIDSRPQATSAIRLVVKGFRQISTLSEFEDTIRRLPKVIRVEPHRYAAGTLELRIELPAGAPTLGADSVVGFDIRPVHSDNGSVEWELRDGV